MGSELVFVDDLQHPYTEANDLGYNEDSNLAPFADCTIYDCYVLLQEMRERTASEFHPSIFAIIDHKSLQDGTMILTEEPEADDAGVQYSVRAVFEMAQSQLALWAVGKTSVTESKARVASVGDGVLRPGMDL